MQASQQGFTLVEAMVAITVLTMSMFATFSWINVSIEMLIRSDEVMTQELLLGEFLEELDLIDLDQEQRGEKAFEDLSMKWTATPVETKSGMNNRGFKGFYDHTLYRVDINVLRESVAIAEYTTRRVTSRKVRDPRFEL